MPTRVNLIVPGKLGNLNLNVVRNGQKANYNPKPSGLNRVLSNNIGRVASSISENYSSVKPKTAVSTTAVSLQSAIDSTLGQLEWGNGVNFSLLG